MATASRRKIEIPSRVDATRQVQDALAQAMADCGYDRKTTFALRLAVEEALSNAIHHGNGDDPSKSVEVSLNLAADQAVITVCDQGTGFVPEQVPDPTCEEHLTCPGGRGVLLIQSYMDEVHYNERGNCLTMIKRIT